MKRRSIVTIGASLSLAALAAGMSPSMAEPVTPLEPSHMVPSLALAQSSADVAMANTLSSHMTGKLAPGTVRLIAQNEMGKYAAALDRSGQEVCVISQLNDADGTIAAACLPKEKFAQQGVGVGVQQNGTPVRTTEVYLLPADVDAAPLIAASQVPSNARMLGRDPEHLVVHSGTEPLPQRMELNRRASTAKFQLGTLIRPHA